MASITPKELVWSEATPGGVRGAVLLLAGPGTQAAPPNDRHSPIRLWASPRGHASQPASVPAWAPGTPLAGVLAPGLETHVCL